MTIYVMRLSEEIKEGKFWNDKTRRLFYFEKILEYTKFVFLL